MVALGASIVLIGTSVVSGVSAHAAEGDLGNIKTDRTGSITLHKHESGTQNAAGQINGANANSVGGAGVAGVTFTAYPISNVNLTTSAGWQKLHNFQVPANACDGNRPSIATLTFGAAKTFPETQADGATVLNRMTVGAYLICETNAPDTVKKKAAPFIVTLPQPGATPGSWVYDIHAFPKNTVINTPVKSVKVTGVGIGEHEDQRQVSFDIRVKIPNLAKNTRANPQSDEFFRYFIIGDSLVAGHTRGQVTAVRLANSDTEAGSDIPATYYEADNNSATRHWLSVSFLEGRTSNTKGLSYLRDNAGKYVVVTIAANTTTLPSDGKLPNTGYLIVDTTKGTQPPYTQQTGRPYNPPTQAGETPTKKSNEPDIIPTNKVVTAWGRVQFTKISDDTPGTPLQGAEFEIYVAANNGEACLPNPTGNAIKVNGKTRFTSNEQGIVEIPGLFVASAASSGQTDPQIGDAHKCYVLKEVVAPLGYILPPGQGAYTPVKVVPGATSTGNVQKISNQRVTVPELPLTGTSGTLIASTVGTGLILASVGAVLVRRRQQMAEGEI